MFDRDSLRAVITGWLAETGSDSALDELSDLGAVHFEVLEMLAEMIVRLADSGYSKADIRLALSEDVVLARSTGPRRAEADRGGRDRN